MSNRWIGFALAGLPRTAWIIFTVLILVWVYNAEGGLGSTDDTSFGWHAFLMTLGFVVFMTEGVLSFSCPLLGVFVTNAAKASRTRDIVRSMHLVFHFGTLVCAILGLVFIVKYKWSSPGVFPFFTMYSAHSWAGVATLGLWTVQVVSSVTFRLAPVPKSLKDGFSDWHQYLGCCVFVSGLATCALGLQDMQSSDLAGSAMLMDGSCMSMPGYAPHSMLAMLASAAALMLIVVGMSTFAAMKFFQQPLFLAEPAEKLEPGPLQT